jgi:hypothetical protein
MTQDGGHRRQLTQGRDLSRVALETLAIDAYRTNRITAHQLCHLLNLPSRYDLDGLLNEHGVLLEYSIDDFEREGLTSARPVAQAAGRTRSSARSLTPQITLSASFDGLHKVRSEHRTRLRDFVLPTSVWRPRELPSASRPRGDL